MSQFLHTGWEVSATRAGGSQSHSVFFSAGGMFFGIFSMRVLGIGCSSHKENKERKRFQGIVPQ